jgi:hypothetical protein
VLCGSFSGLKKPLKVSFSQRWLRPSVSKPESVALKHKEYEAEGAFFSGNREKNQFFLKELIFPVRREKPACFFA